MTSSQPLVTVVTPTLNQGRFIEYTIRSLLAQTMTDFEHIVVDGGSTDDTHDLLRSYESMYRMRWVSGKDSGMYDAINRGLAMAEGAIHAYLNSDDLYFPWTLQVVTSILAERPEVAVVCGDSINVDDATGAEYVRIFPRDNVEQVLRVMPYSQPTVFWRREVTRELAGFRSDFKYVGDWDFLIRASQRFPFLKVDEFLAIERRHGASKTLSETRPMAVENEQMLALYRPSATSRMRASLVGARALSARRATWIRFLREARRANHPSGTPWNKMLGSSELAIDVPRLLAGLVPGVPYRWKVGAIRTGRDWLRPE